MKKGYLGVDIGSISTKGVIIDEDNQIVAQKYMWTEGNPIDAVKRMIRELNKQVKPLDMRVASVGTTGSARKLIGVMLNAGIVKNEITAHAIGTLSIFPEASTIFEIGGQDSKIILIDQGIVVDYAMNTLCAAGTGSFLTSQSKRMGLKVEEIGDLALKSKKPTKIAARCTVFAESDLVHKVQTGHQREDIVAGLCSAVVTNYLNNVGKGKAIKPPIVFQGGVSKNTGVIRAFEQEIGEEIHVDANGHLMGALGVAILSKKAPPKKTFDFNIADCEFETKGIECDQCANHCEIICFYKGKELIDAWGNKCDQGAKLVHRTTH